MSSICGSGRLWRGEVVGNPSSGSCFSRVGSLAGHLCRWHLAGEKLRHCGPLPTTMNLPKQPMSQCDDRGRPLAGPTSHVSERPKHAWVIYAENTSAPGWSVFAFLYDQCGAKTLPLRAQAVRVSEGSRGRIIATGRVKEPSNGRRRGDQLVRHLCNNIGTTDHLGAGT